MDFQELPEHHAKQLLHRDELNPDPFKQLITWLGYAKTQKVEELNAMALATATKKGVPSCRMVLLKHVDDNGLIFYTNYKSRKAQELSENPLASTTFFRPEMMLQINVEGHVEKVSKETSEKYFHSRARESQIAAWASNQGNIIPSRESLESKCEELKKEYEGKELPLPPHWGGYRLIPTRFEFWQGGYHRLHDRFQYLKRDGRWEISRLSP